MSKEASKKPAGIATFAQRAIAIIIDFLIIYIVFFVIDLFVLKNIN